MKIIIDGLGRMGGQIAEKLLAGGHEVVAHNRSPEPIDAMVEKVQSPPTPKKRRSQHLAASRYSCG